MRHKRRMGDWAQVGENLVRHRSGTIYVRAKVAGKVIRASLQTKDLRIAKLKRDTRLQELRAAAAAALSPAACKTLGDAINLAQAATILPHLKPSTLAYYAALFGILSKTLPVATPVDKWTAADALAWWKTQVARYAPQRANNLLALLKRVTATMVERHARADDPAKTLKRVKIQSTEPTIPGQADIARLVESIAAQGKRASKEAAAYVAFLAYSGLRHGEASQVRWEDVGEDFLRVLGGPDGTKSRKPRSLPISAPLRAVIESRRYADAAGPIFHIKTPRIALDNACKRLGIPHLRLHDLRHFFTTWSIEAGIPIPTIAKWLGHQDGGVLLMKTYGHLRDDHSLEQAKRLTSPDSWPPSA